MENRAFKCMCLVVVASLLFAACSTDAERNEAGEVEETKKISFDDLRDGDCYSDGTLKSMESVEIESIEVTPCDEAHEYQVFHIYESAEDDFPGSEALAADAEETCIAEFEGAIGSVYEDSSLEISYLTPQEEGWNEPKGKEIVCAAFDLELNELTQDVIGSNL